jgi:hypothetical protein
VEAQDTSGKWLDGLSRACDFAQTALQGEVHWSASRFERDPDTEKYLRRARPQAEWVTRVLLRAALADIRLGAGDGGSLWASYELHAGELMRAAVTAGRGDRI